MLTTFNHLLVLPMFRNGFLDYLLHDFCRDQGEAYWHVALLVLIAALPKDRQHIFCLPVIKTSSICHGLSKSIASGPAMTLASPLSPPRCIPLDSMDFTLFKYSLINPLWSSTESKLSLLQTLPLFSGTWDSWSLIVPVKTEGRKTLRHKAFSMSFVSMPHPVAGPYFP